MILGIICSKQAMYCSKKKLFGAENYSEQSFASEMPKRLRPNRTDLLAQLIWWLIRSIKDGYRMSFDTLGMWNSARHELAAFHGPRGSDKLPCNGFVLFPLHCQVLQEYTAMSSVSERSQVLAVSIFSNCWADLDADFARIAWPWTEGPKPIAVARPTNWYLQVVTSIEYLQALHADQPKIHVSEVLIPNF